MCRVEKHLGLIFYMGNISVHVIFHQKLQFVKKTAILYEKYVKMHSGHIVCVKMFSSHKMFKTNQFHSELLLKESQWAYILPIIKFNYSKSQK